MAYELMTFGRHVGQPASEVPLKYLLWASSSLADPPSCVVEELKRRASLHGTREAIEAAAAVSSLVFTANTPKAKKRKAKWKQRKLDQYYRSKSRR